MNKLITFIILISLFSSYAFSIDDADFRACSKLTGDERIACAKKASAEEVNEKQKAGKDKAGAFKTAIATITSAVTVYIFMRYKKELKKNHGCAKASVMIMGGASIASMVAELWSRIEYSSKVSDLARDLRDKMAKNKLDGPTIQMEAYDYMISIESARIKSEGIRKTGYTVAALGYGSSALLAGVEVATQIISGEPPSFCKVSQASIDGRKEDRKNYKERRQDKRDKRRELKEDGITNSSVFDPYINFNVSIDDKLISNIEAGKIHVNKEDPLYQGIKAIVKSIITNLIPDVYAQNGLKDIYENDFKTGVKEVSDRLVNNNSGGFISKDGKFIKDTFEGNYDTVLEYLCSGGEADHLKKSTTKQDNIAYSKENVAKYDGKVSGKGSLYSKDTVAKYQQKYCKEYDALVLIRNNKLKGLTKSNDLIGKNNDTLLNKKVSVKQIESRFEFEKAKVLKRKKVEKIVKKPLNSVVKFISVPWRRLAYSVVMGSFSNMLRIEASQNQDMAEKRKEALEKLKQDIIEKYGLDGGKIEMVKLKTKTNAFKAGDWNATSGNGNYTPVKTCIDSNKKPDLDCECVRRKSCLKLIPKFKFNQAGLASVYEANAMVNSATQGAFSDGSFNFNKADQLTSALRASTGKILKQIAKKDPSLAKKIGKLAKSIPLTLGKSLAPFKNAIIADATAANSILALPTSLPISKKIKDQMKIDLKKAEFETSSGGDPAKKSDSGFDLDFGDDESSISEIEQEKLSKIMNKDYEYNNNDINSRKDQNIFKILSNRYLQSGLKRLFE